MSDVAAGLGCDWHTANRALVAWGLALLAADCARVGAVEALGVDKTLFGRQASGRTRRWCTSIVDVTGASCLTLSLAAMPEVRLAGCWISPRRSARTSIGVCWTYRHSFEMALPHLGQVADPFHVVGQANNSIDEVRRRVPNDIRWVTAAATTIPRWQARRLLISVYERLGDRGDAKLHGLLRAGDPAAKCAWHRKPKKHSAGSMTSTALNSPAPTSASSLRISPTLTARRSCAAWAAPSVAGTTPS